VDGLLDERRLLGGAILYEDFAPPVPIQDVRVADDLPLVLLLRHLGAVGVDQASGRLDLEEVGRDRRVGAAAHGEEGEDDGGDGQNEGEGVDLHVFLQERHASLSGGGVI